MNTGTLKVALSASNAAWNQFKKYRDDKAVNAYDSLSEAAGSFEGLRERGSELLDDSRREAGNVTKAARARLEKALAEAGEKGQELSGETHKTGKKVGKRASKKAQKAQKKAAAKAARKEKGGNKWRNFGLFAALLATLAGGAYWWLNRKETPGTTPPRVEEEAGDTETESTLVYSTETPEDAEPTVGKVRSEEELLASLDEQLEKHRSEEDTADEETAEADPVPAGSQTPVTDAAEAAAEAAAAEAEAEEEEDETAAEDETVASEELLAEGEEIQAEYDRNHSPKNDQSDKD